MDVSDALDSIEAFLCTMVGTTGGAMVNGMLPVALTGLLAEKGVVGSDCVTSKSTADISGFGIALALDRKCSVLSSAGCTEVNGTSSGTVGPETTPRVVAVFVT